LNSSRGEVIGLEETLETLYFYLKIDDYESSADVVGTGFWRPPEVLFKLFKMEPSLYGMGLEQARKLL